MQAPVLIKNTIFAPSNTKVHTADKVKHCSFQVWAFCLPQYYLMGLQFAYISLTFSSFTAF